MTPLPYEIAVELKDAGFPQEGDRIQIHPPWCAGWDQCKEGFTGKQCTKKDQVYSPTLSELIEACGEKFMLTNECGTWEAWSGSISSMVRMGEAGAQFECEGSTPEEAVARLWLALNKESYHADTHLGDD